MRVVLRPVPSHPDAVGLVDGAPLTYESRVPHVGGRPVEHAVIAEALSDAVEAAAGAVFGGDYVNPMARATGLNRRTVTRDRVLRNGLPAWALGFLARAAAYEHPRAMGYMLQAAAEMSERGVLAQGDALPGVHPRDREHLAVVARLGLDEALELVAVARDAKRLPVVDRE